ncbi:FAD-binding domain-containing protein [Bimuria novae-zelandiae CBS 107.79]|uniref:FAD-binding domain-containing protein n=1 Tax=Bimuria novae-zelandiae CBS 107.79 TaxID=1447943 RepID=A0A6A5V3Y0_9PLEO|nr:FAD-binding domain-containing protein [Bimuria novae-zelandiae CBS 107.79]
MAVQELQADADLRQPACDPDITTTISPQLHDFLAGLEQRGIKVSAPHRQSFPPEAIMHDRAAIVPTVIVLPRSEWGVIETLKLLTSLRLYNKHAVLVRSGGHGYHNGGLCSGIIINLGYIANQRIVDNVLFLEPGCILGQLISTLVDHKKAVPHGDCFGVGAGGHFLTAGWDIALARRYGLGCQLVTGGRIVLWDGSVVDVDEKNHPKLLYAMRGGAAAGVGVVTEIRLQLIDQPPLVSWRFQSLSKAQLETCVAHQAFASAANLPKDISISFRFYFEPDQHDPVCSFNVCLSEHLGSAVASIVAKRSAWHKKPLVDLRMVPASEALAANPQMLAEVTPMALHESPLTYWKPTVSSREMARSYFTSLYHAFQSVRVAHARERMYALVIQGGGRMTELQYQCSMPLGQSLARFEMHWDTPEDKRWSRSFTERISRIIESKLDRGPSRPYRGDIWLKEQERDDTLEAILRCYDRRSAV